MDGVLLRSVIMATKRVASYPTDLTAAPVEGADFSKLPENVQRAVTQGFFNPGQEWQSLNQFLNAPPERRIAAIRELKGLSQSQLAAKSGIRQADVSAAERNVDDVKVSIVRKIAAALGLRVTEVLNDYVGEG